MAKKEEEKKKKRIEEKRKEGEREGPYFLVQVPRPERNHTCWYKPYVLCKIQAVVQISRS
jgi:hypothetical protein